MIRGRVIVIAHNLALGKNLALTSAFYNCAKKNSNDSIFFFSLLHDFAEEGRIREIDTIRNVGRFQNDIKKQMYCIGAPVKIVVPNKSTMHMMLKCGFDVTTVSNPVNLEKIEVDKKKIEFIRHSVFYHAHEQLLPFDKNKQLAYYPVRIIPRKNIYEAILISCIFFDSSLITGPSGNSKQDIVNYRNLDNFVRKNKLPVMTDILTKCNLQSDYSDKLVEIMMLAVDYVISTSVAEGFGYTLFEPWIQKKMLIARKITGYSMPDGWNGDSMYSFLPVPVKWIDIDRVRKEYDKYFIDCFGEKRTWPFEKYFVYDAFIDFSVLPECVQISVIEMILNDNNMRNDWLKILEKSINGWPGLHKVYNSAKQSVGYHSKIVSTEFSESMLKKAFSEVFLMDNSNKLQQGEYQKIETHFQQPEYFRLLSGDQYCRICDK